MKTESEMSQMSRLVIVLVAGTLALAHGSTVAVRAAEVKPAPAQQLHPFTAWAQGCGRDGRNMAAQATGLPDRFEEVCEKKPDGSGLLNVRWVGNQGRTE